MLATYSTAFHPYQKPKPFYFQSQSGILTKVVAKNERLAEEIYKINIVAGLSYPSFLGVKYDIKIIAKETQFINQIKIAFSNLDMKEQFQCLNYRIDIYFPMFKLAIEFDENHSYKGSNEDIKRQQLCENYLGCKFIRVKETDDIFVVINTIIINILNKKS